MVLEVDYNSMVGKTL